LRYREAEEQKIAVPALNISAPHQLPQNEALRRIKSYIEGVRTQFADKVRDLRENWNGNEGTFSGSGAASLQRGTSL
jgi:hypothetical protein